MLVCKSWADLDKLKPWIATEIMSRQVPALSPEKEFAETLRSLGCLVSGEHPIMDAKKHRIEVEGDKKGKRLVFMSLTWTATHPAISKITVLASN